MAHGCISSKGEGIGVKSARFGRKPVMSCPSQTSQAWAVKGRVFFFRTPIWMVESIFWLARADDPARDWLRQVAKGVSRAAVWVNIQALCLGSCRWGATPEFCRLMVAAILMMSLKERVFSKTTKYICRENALPKKSFSGRDKARKVVIFDMKTMACCGGGLSGVYDQASLG